MGAGQKRSQVSVSAPPRKINVAKLAEARAPELEALHSIVANRLDNDFKSRRNKRRRTTAYDNQAAKRRGRKRQKSGVGGKKTEVNSEREEGKKVSRRIRRRLELKLNPISGFCTSSDGTKRLRTHVWHAKRFTMTKLWGYHLPLGLQGRGRGSRALLKWFKNGVVVHDATYHVAVQLEGPEDSLMSIVNSMLVPSLSNQSEDVLKSVCSGAIYATAMLHHFGAPSSQSISPVTYMWRPLNQQKDDSGCEPNGIGSCSIFRHLWVWIHASAFAEGLDALTLACQKEMTERGIQINCRSLEGQLAKLEMMGSNALELLQKILHPVTCISSSAWQLNRSSFGADLDFQVNKSSILEKGNLSFCEVLSFTVNDPRSPPNKTSDVSDMNRTVLEDTPESERKEIEALDKKKELFSPLQSVTIQNGINYDEKTLWNVCDGLDPPAKDELICLERHCAKMDFIGLEDPEAEKLKASTSIQSSKCCPVLLFNNKKQENSLPRWSMILPLSWVKVFWTKFVNMGAHAVGLREKRWIACDLGLPFFPYDFPYSHAYSSFMAAGAAAAVEKAEKRPVAVRPVKLPLPPPWDCVRISWEKDLSLRDALLMSKSTDCDAKSFSDRTNSFDGTVAKTSSVLTHYLDEVCSKKLLLFPQAPNSEENFQKFMKEKSTGQDRSTTVDDVSGDSKLCFLRVLLRAFKEGTFEDGAVVCAPRLSDLSLWLSRPDNIDASLQIPQSVVGSYFKEKSSGKWEFQVPDDPALLESHRWPIGFVTTGFVRGSKKPTAVAFCEAGLLARLREMQWNEFAVKRRKRDIYVLVRNLNSSAFRLALATIVLEQQKEDIDFM